jgi:hypothetical protein
MLTFSTHVVEDHPSLLSPDDVAPIAHYWCLCAPLPHPHRRALRRLAPTTSAE